jgi:hypothetical protein
MSGPDPTLEILVEIQQPRFPRDLPSIQTPRHILQLTHGWRRIKASKAGKLDKHLEEEELHASIAFSA